MYIKVSSSEDRWLREAVIKADTWKSPGCLPFLGPGKPLDGRQRQKEAFPWQIKNDKDKTEQNECSYFVLYFFCMGCYTI